MNQMMVYLTVKAAFTCTKKNSAHSPDTSDQTHYTAQCKNSGDHYFSHTHLENPKTYTFVSVEI